MLIRQLEALPRTKEGSEQLPACTKLQGVSRRCVQVELVSRSRKMPTPPEFGRSGKRDLGCPPARHCLRWLREGRTGRETSLHIKARSTWPVDDTTRAREVSCSAKSSPMLERQSTMELTFQSSDHR